MVRQAGQAVGGVRLGGPYKYSYMIRAGLCGGEGPREELQLTGSRGEKNERI